MPETLDFLNVMIIDADVKDGSSIGQTRQESVAKVSQNLEGHHAWNQRGQANG